jgi:hypothetical protein
VPARAGGGIIDGETRGGGGGSGRDGRGVDRRMPGGGGVFRRGGVAAGGNDDGDLRCEGGARTLLAEGEPETRTFAGDGGTVRFTGGGSMFAAGGCKLGDRASAFGGGGRRLSGPPSSRA